MNQTMRNLKEWTEQTGMAATTKHTGKMHDMMSFSTDVLSNPICNARRGKCDSVCSECYAAAMVEVYENLGKKLKKNLALISYRLYDVSEFPRVFAADCHGCFRLESFGDVSNAIHAANYMRWASGSNDTIFTAWTKNVNLYDMAVSLGMATKPANMNLGQSAEYLNTEPIVTSPLVDFTFTVYDGDYIIENDLKPTFFNCGARDCLGCMTCYTKHNGLFHVHEILKKDVKRVYKHWREMGYIA